MATFQFHVPLLAGVAPAATIEQFEKAVAREFGGEVMVTRAETPATRDATVLIGEGALFVGTVVFHLVMHREFFKETTKLHETLRRLGASAIQSRGGGDEGEPKVVVGSTPVPVKELSPEHLEDLQAYHGR